MTRPVAKRKSAAPSTEHYSGLVEGIRDLLEAARRSSARAVNALMTATYWEIGRRIVEFEQGGEKRAGYGEEVLKRLAEDLTARHGRGFSVQNLENMRLFYSVCGTPEISQTLSGKLGLSTPTGSATVYNSQTPSGKSETQSPNAQTSSAQSPGIPFNLADVARAFPLPWSAYVLLVRRSRSPEAFAFYHAEALRGGWSVRQLQRQIDSQFSGSPVSEVRTSASSSGRLGFNAKTGLKRCSLPSSETSRIELEPERQRRSGSATRSCRNS